MPRDPIVDSAPRIPIAGAAAQLIYTALARLATHCGECAVTVKKERVAGGGYAYVICNHLTPERLRPDGNKGPTP